jgi:hypothetical protein
MMKAPFPMCDVDAAVQHRSFRIAESAVHTAKRSQRA